MKHQSGLLLTEEGGMLRRKEWPGRYGQLRTNHSRLAAPPIVSSREVRERMSMEICVFGKCGVSEPGQSRIWPKSCGRRGGGPTALPAKGGAGHWHRTSDDDFGGIFLRLRAGPGGAGSSGMLRTSESSGFTGQLAQAVRDSTEEQLWIKCTLRAESLASCQLRILPRDLTTTSTAQS